MATKTTEKAAAKNGFSLISHDKLKQIYETMFKYRALEEHLVRLLKQRALAKKYCSVVGLEATIIGAAIDLRSGDTIVPSHRDLITNLIKGIPPATILTHFFARASGPEGTRLSRSGNGVNSVDRPAAPGQQLKIATDIALANKARNGGHIVLAFSGEGSLRAWDMAIQVAGRHHLPIVFVAQQDLAMERDNKKRQPVLFDSCRRAKACGFPGIPVDGSDVVAVYRVAFEALARARQGGGPTLIDCKHCLPHRDPIDMMEDYLKRKNLFTAARNEQTLGEFQKELLDAVAFASSGRKV